LIYSITNLVAPVENVPVIEAPLEEEEPPKEEEIVLDPLDVMVSQ